ncbi:MAG: hypothetical protein NVS3B6_13130 [Pseudarthrobacter sp.]
MRLQVKVVLGAVGVGVRGVGREGIPGFEAVSRVNRYILTDESGVPTDIEVKPDMSGKPLVYAPEGTPSLSWSYSIRAEYLVDSTGVVWKSNTPTIKIC